VRALAETENTQRQGERREQDAQQYAIRRNLPVSCCRLSTICVVPSTRVPTDAEAGKGAAGLIEGVAATDRILTQILNRFGVQEINALDEPFDPGNTKR